MRLPAIRNVIAEELIWAVKKNQAISKIETMDQVLSESLARRRLYMILLGVFAGAALLLAGVGIYGVISYSVNQREREIGIRMALGATAANVQVMILGEVLKLIAIGVSSGLVIALAGSQAVRSLLFVSGPDVLTFVLVPALLTLVAILACWLPVVRATRIDPVTALRNE